MRRVLAALLVFVAFTMSPASVSAAPPIRATGVANQSVDLPQPYLPCWGNRGAVVFATDYRLVGHPSPNSMAVRLQGTVSTHLWMSLGSELPHLYEGSTTQMRFNEVVTPDPEVPELAIAYRSESVDMVPVGGGAPIVVHVEIWAYAHWLPDGSTILEAQVARIGCR